MTLSEIAESQRKTMNVGQALREVLLRAMEQERTICGVSECAQFMDSDPDAVMLCILPQSKVQDISIRIQHTLIEAYCRENDIRMLKIDSALKLSTLHTSALGKSDKAGKDRELAPDFSCIIVRPPVQTSPEDDFVNNYCDDFILGDLDQHGVIDLVV